MQNISLLDAFKLFWKKAFVLKGRATRKEYWGAALFNFIISLVLSLIGSIINVLLNVPSDEIFKPGESLSGIYGLICLIPQFTLTARRLQDINMPGLLAIIPSFGTAILGIIGIVLMIIDIEKFTLTAIILFLITLVVSLLFFVFALLDGTVGPNKYGEDPKGRIRYNNV